MSKKQKILLIEDDKESADEYLEDASTYLAGYDVLFEMPPNEISGVVELIKKYNVTAVVVDERLRQRSDAGYLGIDVLNYLKNAKPGLPVAILTEYEQDAVLRKVPSEQLFRKIDLLKDAGKKYHFDIVKDLIKQYQKKQNKIISQKKVVSKINKSNVKEIARLHFLMDNSIEKIVWVRNSKRKEIQLLEVSRTSLPTQSVEPFLISANKEVVIDLIVADITPQEWKSIQKNKIKLPSGWDLTKITSFDREELIGKE
jgi:DNA-binding NarL/FixJ family response regulator